MARRFLAVGLRLCFPALLRAGDKNAAAADAFFEAKVRPILAAHCFSCHGPKKQSSDLRLDVRSSVLEVRERGAAIVPGQPDKSLLIQAVRQAGELKMPPQDKLRPEQIEVLVEWIKM